jgi:hypothetical protein
MILISFIPHLRDDEFIIYEAKKCTLAYLIEFQ